MQSQSDLKLVLSCQLVCDNAGQKIGEHIDAVRSIHYSVSSRVVVTGSWDASVMVWDTRSLECVGNHPQVNEVIGLEDLVFTEL